MGPPLIPEMVPKSRPLAEIDNWTVQSPSIPASLSPDSSSSDSSSPSSSSSSSRMLDAAERICGGYIVPIVCVFGITCNAFNTIILTRRSMKGSPYTYLLALAVTDIMVLTLSLVESALAKPFGQGIFFWQLYDAYIFYPFANVFSNSSVWITVIMTLERYISVRYPLKAKEICTRRLARRTIVATVLISLVVNLPRFFCSAVMRNDAGTYERRSTEFESSDFYRLFTWLHIAVLHFIPCLLLMYLNASLIAIVFKANRRRAQLRASPTGSRREKCGGGGGGAGGSGSHGDVTCHSTEQIRLTITCISIICLFLICIVPSAFSNRPVAKALFGRNQTMHEFTRGSFYRLLRVITNLLVYCNLSLNFVLYCVFNHKFLYALRYFGRTCLYRAERRVVATSIGGRFRRLSSTTSAGNTSESVKLPCAVIHVDGGGGIRESVGRWGGRGVPPGRVMTRLVRDSSLEGKEFRVERSYSTGGRLFQFPLRPVPRFQWNNYNDTPGNVKPPSK